MEQSRAHGATLSYTTHTSHTQAHPYVCAYMSAHSSASILQAMRQKCQPQSRAQAVLNVAVTKHEPSYAMLEESHKQHEAQRFKEYCILHSEKTMWTRATALCPSESRRMRRSVTLSVSATMCECVNERVSEWVCAEWANVLCYTPSLHRCLSVSPG